MNENYYVYVYIDPRNFEEFYYGKGKGDRKKAHLTEVSDSEKTKRIIAIRKEGLELIVKVIAKGLTEREAFLIEKAKRVLDFKYEGKNLKSQNLVSHDLFKNSDNENSEFLVKIKWIKSFPATGGKWKSRAGLYTTPLIKASLERQIETIKFLEKEFEVSFLELMNE